MDFVARHAEVVVWALLFLVNLLFVASATLAKVKFGSIDKHQETQDKRLSKIEAIVRSLEGSNVASGKDVAHIADLLEVYVEQLRDQIKSNQDANADDFRELKDLLRGKQPQIDPVG